MILFAANAVADKQVSVVAFASPAYTERKFSGSEVRPESYVFMEGHYFSGIRVDHSIDRMTFRHIAESLATELARDQFFPAQDPHSADLLVVVHWGTTRPYISEEETSARTRNPQVTDMAGTSASGANEAQQLAAWDIGAPAAASADVQAITQRESTDPRAATGSNDSQISTYGLSQIAREVDSQMSQAANMQLLGYTREMLRLNRSGFSSAEEDSLRFELSTERYFIILKAYDLREKISPGEKRRAVWTVYLNMRSPGIDFASALAAMGQTAVSYAGRTTDKVQIATPRRLTPRIDFGPLIILGEAKP